ncbi:MAG: sortase [Chloroflexi bacterium]|nr:sortase [Chloroflexota bacterium]
MLRPALVTAVVLAALLSLANCYGPWPPALRPAPPSASPTPSAVVSGATVSPAVAAPVRIPDGYRVRVARLGIDLPIAEGDVQRDIDLQKTPEGYAFHLPGTSIPGRGSNTYLYAHARTGMFLALWDARVGDDVTILGPDGAVLRYVVTEVRPKVPASDVSVAQPTSDERLTLQTSTGPSPEDPRFVVIARPK